MGPEVIVPVTMFVCTTALVFGLRYMSNKEKMAMIERGLEPSFKPRASAPKPFVSLKFGLLLVGLGLGLLIALFTVRATGLDDDEGVAVYFGCLSICGGLGLILSYVVEKNWLDKQKDLN
ncbi:DUF6249 domain-containing protein [Pedobacter caeni]|uniref:DUF6249 domain-containing protein n=1 Tax=Pedobacter caeni TaxID=288992 RepID=A0A1M5MC78_9SPHI|nr:DUF6249 domain-containing protein [Pedobacter caeni]SHG74867.1 hypothetical protein SAMN04488522_107140 [Pedobacter caeni]